MHTIGAKKPLSFWLWFTIDVLLWTCVGIVIVSMLIEYETQLDITSKECKNLLNSINEEHERQFNSINEDHKKQLNIINKEHKRQLNSINEQHERQLNIINKEHERMLNSINEKHERQLNSINEEHEKHLNVTNKEHKRQLNSINEEHEKQLNITNIEHKSQLNSIKEKHERHLNSINEEHKEQLNITNKEHKSQLNSINEEHERQLNSINEEHKKQLNMQNEEHKKQLNEAEMKCKKQIDIMKEREMVISNQVHLIKRFKVGMDEAQKSMDQYIISIEKYCDLKAKSNSIFKTYLLSREEEDQMYRLRDYLQLEAYGISDVDLKTATVIVRQSTKETQKILSSLLKKLEDALINKDIGKMKRLQGMSEMESSAVLNSHMEHVKLRIISSSRELQARGVFDQIFSALYDFLMETMSDIGIPLLKKIFRGILLE